MGVYIKGMEMPTRCWDCDLCYDSFYCKGLEVQFSDREDFEPGERRLSDCPLVPAPPHGRLIEAEPIMKFITDGLNSGEFGYDQIKVLTEIQYAPTIIEAEKGET